MWEDTLKTKFADEEVEVVRTFEPATPDTTYLKFPDGSQLKLEVEVNVPDDVHGEGEAMDIAWAQSAGKWYGKIIEKLYADATEKHIDVDFLQCASM